MPCPKCGADSVEDDNPWFQEYKCGSDEPHMDYGFNQSEECKKREETQK